MGNQVLRAAGNFDGAEGTGSFQGMCLCGENKPAGKWENRIKNIAFAMRNAKSPEEFKSATRRLGMLLAAKARENPEFGSFKLLKSKPATTQDGYKISFTLATKDGITKREMLINGEYFCGEMGYRMRSDYRSKEWQAFQSSFDQDEKHLIWSINNMLSDVGLFPKWIEKINPQFEVSPGHYAWK